MIAINVDEVELLPTSDKVRKHVNRIIWDPFEVFLERKPFDLRQPDSVPARFLKRIDSNVLGYLLRSHCIQNPHSRKTIGKTNFEASLGPYAMQKPMEERALRNTHPNFAINN